MMGLEERWDSRLQLGVRRGFIFRFVMMAQRGVVALFDIRVPIILNIGEAGDKGH